MRIPITETTSWVIYGLKDSVDDSIRYIGVSRNPKKRLKKHIEETKAGKKTHKCNWLRELLSKGLQPEIVILEEGTGLSWEEREKFWIGEYKKKGSLTNSTLGGEGFLGNVVSEDRKIEHSEKMKKLWKDPVWVANWKKSNSGRKHTEESKAKMKVVQKNVWSNLDLRKKVSETVKRRLQDPKERLKLSIGHKGLVKSSETCNKISENNKRRASTPEGQVILSKMRARALENNYKKIGSIWCYNTSNPSETKMIKEEKDIPAGWIKGRKPKNKI